MPAVVQEKSKRLRSISRASHGKITLHRYGMFVADKFGGNNPSFYCLLNHITPPKKCDLRLVSSLQG